ncbi:MAG: diacylglycerol kinase family lipid kinase [Clostridia bacterium]|nr:diacylglycerol kinase family lipid kinase [Clostridia bacterium]
MKVLFILNPKAGRMSGKRNLYSILDMYEKYGNVEVELFETSARGDATAVVLEKAKQFDRVVCCGGDGTLNETVTGLMQLENPPELGYIPAGSTNDFATSLGIRGDLKKNTRRTVKGDPFPIDVGSFNDRYFTYTASFGAFTQSSYNTQQNIKNTFGHLAYVFQGIKDLSSIRAYSIKVTADGVDYSDNYVFGAICNSTSLGGIIRLKKNLVKFNDGYFELVLVRNPKNPVDFANLISALAKQDFQNNDSIVFLHAKKIIVQTEEPMPWSLDGEYEAGKNENVIENKQRALRIVV